MNCRIYENKNVKLFRSPDYNYNFDKNTGAFERWGKTEDDDPSYCPYGPELADLEISDICYGPHGDGRVCDFCYKSNTPNGNFMDFDTFKKVFDLLPPTVTQIAFGVDSQCITNPDTFKIMKYTRDNGIIPNVTVANISDDVAEKLSNICGAVSVSRYNDKEICYNSVEKLTNKGINQVNIHVMVSEETLDNIYETLNDYLNDSRLSGIGAIILLSLKQKGRGEKYTPLSQDKFDDLVNQAMNNNIPLGFDSCSVPKLEKTLEGTSKKKELEEYIEPCESSCQSWYCNTDGYFFPCSFVEGEGDWVNGIHYSEVENFINDVWFNKQTINFRDNLIYNGKSCPFFNI